MKEFYVKTKDNKSRILVMIPNTPKRRFISILQKIFLLMKDFSDKIDFQILWKLKKNLLKNNS